MSELLRSVNDLAISPAMELLPPRMDSPEARVQLLTIGLQESRLIHRFQIVAGRPGRKGPARGLLQFEEGGAVFGVMSHANSKSLAKEVCAARGVVFQADIVHKRLEFDDVLAMAFGRLLLYTDWRPLPKMDADHQEAWDYYERNWQPGKPHRETWDAFHQQAREFILESTE